MILWISKFFFVVAADFFGVWSEIITTNCLCLLIWQKNNLCVRSIRNNSISIQNFKWKKNLRICYYCEWYDFVCLLNLRILKKFISFLYVFQHVKYKKTHRAHTIRQKKNTQSNTRRVSNRWLSINRLTVIFYVKRQQQQQQRWFSMKLGPHVVCTLQHTQYTLFLQCNPLQICWHFFLTFLK